MFRTAGLPGVHPGGAARCALWSGSLDSATALLLGAASAALGRLRFGSASAALGRGLLRVTRLGAGSAAFAGRCAASGRKTGARDETGYAEPRQELLKLLCVHSTPPFVLIAYALKLPMDCERNDKQL